MAGQQPELEIHIRPTIPGPFLSIFNSYVTVITRGSSEILLLPWRASCSNRSWLGAGRNLAALMTAMERQTAIQRVAENMEKQTEQHVLHLNYNRKVEVESSRST